MFRCSTGTVAYKDVTGSLVAHPELARAVPLYRTSNLLEVVRALGDGDAIWARLEQWEVRGEDGALHRDELRRRLGLEAPHLTQHVLEAATVRRRP